MIIEREESLFNREMQPKGIPVMFIREEALYIGTRLNYESAIPSLKTIHPTTDDLKVIHNLNRLDQYIIRSADYDRYVELLWDVQHGCLERFHLWLTNKGLKEYQDRFVNFADTYFTFVYSCGHEDPVTLKSITRKYLIEFMALYLLKNASMELWEYILCPVSLRLFYKFLSEKRYLTKTPDRVIGQIDEFEPEFIEILGEDFLKGASG
jgi:hypothetical protein